MQTLATGRNHTTRGEEHISVVVCTRGRHDMLLRCLESLGALDDDYHEIIVVDNNEEPIESTSGMGPRVRYVHEPRRGLDVARNRGIEEAKGEIVAFIDDDCQASRGWLRGLRQGFDDPAVGCVTGRVVAARMDRDAHRWFEVITTFDRGPEFLRFSANGQPSLVPNVAARLGTGCNMAFRAATLDRIGQFDEALDMGTLVGGGGDLDILGRVLDAGEDAAYVPAALVRHHHRDSMSELRWQLFGYGVSVGALSWKFATTARTSRRANIRFQGFWLRWNIYLAKQRLLRRGGSPISLLALQLFGTLLGPFAYALSKRRRR